jgi:intracellular septation protein A
MLKTKFKFTLDDDPGQWRMVVHEILKGGHRQRFVVSRGDRVIFDETYDAGDDVLARTRHLHLEDFDLDIEFGAVSLSKYAIIIRRNDDILWRSSKKDFRTAGKFEAAIAKLDMDEEMTPEKQAMLERQKKLRPSIIIDISFGVLFFFVAREFGLVTAALTGAAATLVLFAVQPFTKHDLLGGFAVFGVVMSLISAGIAWGFQDDLAVKLRGTFMACIAAAFALYDGFVLKGGYLGERMAMYMEGLGQINPRRASFALAGATLLLMMIDTPLAFILTTDQWIWYNAFFDNLIAIPIIIGAMLMAREKHVKKEFQND